MVSVRGTDTICTIQKINHLLYRLERTDTKINFQKKTSFCRRPDPRRGSGGGRRRPRPDPVEGGGGAWPRGRRGGEGGRWWAHARPRGRRGGEGGRRWKPLVVVVAEVGKESVGGRRSSSWSPKWGRRALVGAAHPRGRRGGEGECRWEPLVLVVTEVGKEGVGGSRSSSWSPRWGRRASVGRRRPPLPHHAAAYRLRLAKPIDRHASAYRADCRLAKTREKREERGPNERREKREDPTRG
jgi:hypothetical protein